jgi:hypothetical protein
LGKEQENISKASQPLFKDVDDAVTRLIPYHIYQLPRLEKLVDEFPTSDAKLISDAMDVLQEFDKVLEAEDSLEAGLLMKCAGLICQNE